MDGAVSGGVVIRASNGVASKYFYLICDVCFEKISLFFTHLNIYRKRVKLAGPWGTAPFNKVIFDECLINANSVPQAIAAITALLGDKKKDISKTESKQGVVMLDVDEDTFSLT